MIEFTYKWNLLDLKKVKSNGLKVFSCFACGGGSTMGYKMSGFEVLGCNEIEPKIADLYKTNHNPKYCFVEPIQLFKARTDLPEELYNLDILDGSPPCSTFSMAGSREKKWSKMAKFREGQSEQILSDLFFDFIDLAEKLKPKVVISENVKGILQGNAKGYVKEIVKRFKAIGYDTQIFLLNGATMGLPQARERVFFISHKTDKKIKLNFNEKKIGLGKALEGISDKEHLTKQQEFYWKKCKPGESFSKYHPKGSLFGYSKASFDFPSKTLTTKTDAILHFKEKRRLNLKEWQLIGSYPLDYNFKKYNGKYLIGMSVPPLMMHKISKEVAKQLFGIKYA